MKFAGPYVPAVLKSRTRARFARASDKVLGRVQGSGFRVQEQRLRLRLRLRLRRNPENLASA
jgi:hypothetical protein